MNIQLKLGVILTATIAYAANAAPQNESSPQQPMNAPMSQESSVVFTPVELTALKKLAEQAKMSDYSGNVGTAPAHKTVSATGAAIEETPSGPQAFLFWTQTLSNGFYYEGRLYGKYNTQSQNPFFPDVQPSQEQNPMGYKGVIKLGYAFRVNSIYDITPYLRLEAGKDMSLVYADTNGNYINSTNYAILPGFKQTFKITDNFAPYIDIYGGVNYVSLNGNLYDNGGSGAWTVNSAQSANVNQYQITYELGSAFKITEHQSIIPYIQFQYNTNDADSVAAAPKNKNGFGVSTLTTNQQVYALKYSYAW